MEALRHRGEDASLLASTFPSGIVPAHGVLLAATGSTRHGQYVRFLDSLDRHLRTTQYDIVHAMLPVRQCDVYHPHAGLAVEVVAQGHRKYVGPIQQLLAKTANRFNARRQEFAAVERALLESPNPPVVLCLSEYVKGLVGQHYTLPSGKLATLFNATDLNRFDPAQRPKAGVEIRERFQIPPDRIVALMIAQDFARKGLREAIRALARVADPRLTLLVVGKQNPRAYRDVAARAGVGDRVIFAGPTTDSHSFYRAADFFVLPTRHDPCSLVVLEALAMGVPVISTAFNGACEIMTDGVHGFILKDPADIEALAGAMRQLLDSDKRARMSEACLSLRSALSYEHHLDNLLRIYASIPTSRG
jgi:UDP-glucose:(heptosyl)LPS alpha-1,3-glucosyltransferase